MVDQIAFNTHDVPMREEATVGRSVYNNAGLHDTDTQGPTITRYHGGEWRPGMRQLIVGSLEWSMWQGFHQPNKRLPVRDYTRINTAGSKPIRLWDASSMPASIPLNTYIPNPGQLTANPYGMNAQTVQSGGQIWRTW